MPIVVGSFPVYLRPFAFFLLQSPEQPEDQNDEENGPDDAVRAVAEPITAGWKRAEQQQDQDDK